MALDSKSGKILWQIADPTGAIDVGALSVADDVVFAPSYSGAMNALDARTGPILWIFQSGGSVVDGPPGVRTPLVVESFTRLPLRADQPMVLVLTLSNS